jgi:hypothetical protein
MAVRVRSAASTRRRAHVVSDVELDKCALKQAPILLKVPLCVCIEVLQRSASASRLRSRSHIPQLGSRCTGSSPLFSEEGPPGAGGLASDKLPPRSAPATEQHTKSIACDVDASILALQRTNQAQDSTHLRDVAETEVERVIQPREDLAPANSGQVNWGVPPARPTRKCTVAGCCAAC